MAHPYRTFLDSLGKSQPFKIAGRPDLFTEPRFWQFFEAGRLLGLIPIEAVALWQRRNPSGENLGETVAGLIRAIGDPSSVSARFSRLRAIDNILAKLFEGHPLTHDERDQLARHGIQPDPPHPDWESELSAALQRLHAGTGWLARFADEHGRERNGRLQETRQTMADLQAFLVSDARVRTRTIIWYAGTTGPATHAVITRAAAADILLNWNLYLEDIARRVSDIAASDNADEKREKVKSLKELLND